jgi:hypothetical protein
MTDPAIPEPHAQDVHAPPPEHLRHPRILFWARIIAAIVTVIVLYFGTYFFLFEHDRFAYAPDGTPIFCSSFDFAGQFTGGTKGGLPAAPMRASVLNYVFLPVDYLYCTPRLVGYTNMQRASCTCAGWRDLAGW